jgi:hypothetical protein
MFISKISIRLVWAGHYRFQEQLARMGGSLRTPYPANGEIQPNIAQVRKTLNEFTCSSVEGPVQKIDARLIKPPDLSRYPRITLQANFYADIRDLNATIIYTATIGMRGGAKSWL